MVKFEAWHHPVLVVAEGWPSVAFAAQAVGCLDITTWCKFGSAKSKVEFTSTRLGSTLVESSLDELAELFSTQSTLTVLIQGGASFCDQIRIWTDKSFPHAKFLKLIPDNDVSSWDDTFLWKGELSHQALGGVTSGTWVYRCSEPLSKAREGLDQNLGLILKPTHGGRALSKVREAVLKERKPLVGNNLIDPAVILPWVISPSVFTQDEERVI